jgi:hypothetical protein
MEADPAVWVLGDPLGQLVLLPVNSLSEDSVVRVTIRKFEIAGLRPPCPSFSRPNASSSSRKSSSLPRDSYGGVFAGRWRQPLPALRPGVAALFGRFLLAGLQSPGLACLSHSLVQPGYLISRRAPLLYRIGPLGATLVVRLTVYGVVFKSYLSGMVSLYLWQGLKVGLCYTHIVSLFRIVANSMPALGFVEKTRPVRHFEESKATKNPASPSEEQSRFFAEFTVSSFAALRTVRSGANGLRMTRPERVSINC